MPSADYPIRPQLWNYYLAWIFLTKSAWGIIHRKLLKFGETNKPYQMGLVTSAPCAGFHNYWNCKRNISPSNQASAVESCPSSSILAQKSFPVLERSPEPLCWSILGPSLSGFYEIQDHLKRRLKHYLLPQSCEGWECLLPHTPGVRGQWLSVVTIPQVKRSLKG